MPPSSEMPGAGDAAPADAVAGPPTHDAVAFAGALRCEGLEVPVSAVVGYVEALGVLGTTRPDDVYWAGRATLVRRHEDIAPYDRCFARVFLGVGGDDRPEGPAPVITFAFDTGADGATGTDDGTDGTDEPDVAVRWSRVEVLRHRDLATCDPGELEELWAALRRLRLGGATRRSRRRAPVGASAGTLDLRRTVRAALRHGGEPLVRHHRAPTTRLRRVVLLVDVSGSMEAYARALLRFAHAAVQSHRPVEAFAFGTRLTRLTREFATRDPDAALRRAAATVVDLHGGTRLGDALAEFNDRWGVRGLARGAEVVILSDGWDRGDPATVAEQMARLHRVAHRVIWVNPLKASPGYAPLAQGMAAALPHVDRFLDGHSLASLEALAALLTDGG